MQKEDLLTDTTFDPCWFLLDYTFKPTYVTNQYTLGQDLADRKQAKKTTHLERHSLYIYWLGFDNFI